MGRLSNEPSVIFEDALRQPLAKGDIVMVSLFDGGLVRRRVARITAAGVWICKESDPIKSLGRLSKHHQMVKINVILNHFS